jgi:prepilin-type N-terminal cleavage/methylation domain-containing protein
MVKIRGYSLIELLFVVAIIVILAGIVVGGFAALSRGSQKARTATIIETVRQSLESFSAEQAGFVQQVEHPLAGSYGDLTYPRMIFRRSIANGEGLLLGAKGQQSLALRGVSLSVLPSAERDRLLLDDDRYSDFRVPMLYGVQRQHLGLLGAAVAKVVQYRRIPASTDPITNPDDVALYPDLTCLVESNDQPSASKKLLDHVFGASGATSTLSKLKAFRLTSETTGAAICYGRVWSTTGVAPQTMMTGETSWDLGRMIDPEHPVYTSGPNVNKPRWVPYTPRGLHLIDAWGNEILYSVPVAGGIPRLISAGADGCFCWHPGNDNTFQTNAEGSKPVGDDKDASRDNIQIAAGTD